MDLALIQLNFITSSNQRLVRLRFRTTNRAQARFHLSPAVYTLAVEPLHQPIRATMQHTGIPITPTSIKVLDGLADNTLLLSSSLANSTVQLACITQFKLAANAKLNKDKTEGFFLIRNYVPEPPYQDMMLQPREYFYYLGDTIVQQIDSEEQTSNAIDKIITRCNIWNYRARTLLDRKLIIQTMVNLDL